MSLPSLAVAVLAYNGRAFLGACLDSILRQTPAPAELVVIDNASTDGSADFVAETYPAVRVLRHRENLGVAEGLNQAVAATRAPVIVLLNQDVELHDGCLAALADTFTPSVAVVGAKLLYPDGTIQHAGGWLQRPLWLAQHDGIGEADDGRWDALRVADALAASPSLAPVPPDLEYVTGAVFAVRRGVWDSLGGMDTLFSPAYFEEVDFCFRARRAGWQVVYQPRAVATHHESTTLGRDSGAYLERYHRNRLRLLLKHVAPDDLLDRFARPEANRTDVLRHHPTAARDADEVAALARAYEDATLRLDTILAHRADAPLSPGIVWALRDMLMGLRHVAEGSAASGTWARIPLPVAGGLALRDAILTLENGQSTSQPPGGRLGAAWSGVSRRLDPRAATEQQDRINHAAAAALRSILTSLEVERAALTVAEVERTANRIALDAVEAELAERAMRLRTKLPLLEQRAADAEDVLLALSRQLADVTRRLAALEDRQTHPQAATVAATPRRLRLAYFSPVSPQATGIATYSEDLLPALARHANVDVFIGDVTPTHPALAALPVFNYREYAARRRRQGYDATLYQMGNHAGYHGFIYETLARFPGIVVLHEYVLHHFMAGYTLDQGRRGEYSWLVGYAAGPEAMDAARAALRGERPMPFYDYPLVEHVLDLSQGALCHSEYAAGLIREARPDLPMAVVPLPTTVTATARPADPARPFTAVTAGYLTPSKGLRPALEGFAQFACDVPSARYVLIGDVEAGFDLVRCIRDAGVADRVEVRGYAPSLAEFDAQIAEADVCLNLRYPTAGETSASLLRILGIGVPAIITDTGWFSEVPDTVSLKIPTPPTARAVAAALHALTDPARRAAMSAAARAWVRDVHDPERAAQGYLDFIEQLIA